MFSTGFSLEEREVKKISEMFFGTTSLAVLCHPARSSSRTAWAPFATVLAISSRWACVRIGEGCESARLSGPATPSNFNGLSCRSASKRSADSQWPNYVPADGGWKAVEGGLD